MASLGDCLPRWNTPAPKEKKIDQIKKIEQYRPGYPRFAALVSSYRHFFLFRRFNKLRARVLLLKQDRLSVLEKKLEEIDDSETSPAFLGKSRLDRNPDRIALLSEIETCLADYDQFVERTHQMLSYDKAQLREVTSLKNWLDGTRCIARDETSYLSHGDELFSLAPIQDSAMFKFESWVEDKLLRVYSSWRDSSVHNSSSDKNVYIYSGPWVKRIAKTMLLFLVTLLLLIPIVICNLISDTGVRIIIVMACTVSYLIILSTLTRSKTIELIVAGTTYATVLIVFVSGTGDAGT